MTEEQEKKLREITAVIQSDVTVAIEGKIVTPKMLKEILLESAKSLEMKKSVS